MSNEEMQISEAQLRALTADMVDMHNETFPTMYAELSEFGSTMRSTRRAEAKLRRADLARSRRRFVLGTGGLVLGTAFLAACGSDDDEAADSPATTPQGGSGSGSGSGTGGGADASALRVNASLENLAVFAYGAALDAAPKGKFGKSVPAAVAEFASHAMKQHQDHADAFNAALTGAGGTAYTEPNPTLAGPVTTMFGEVDSVPKLAMLALTLENTAAATYVKQMGELTSPEALSAVATIGPVERQHAAILSFVLGDYPIPDTFVKLGKTKTSLGAQPGLDA
ncbi:ferritin-like domain-containing protein [Sporichthya sp.]|uniref:ferritin-like domain-containing protein n=1 Tax=Sporichthya sp. TaxID=65475 RepID=UPI00182CCF11|nr:ferritin-like domain-containing protein [Sporichthya sp.]MBA3742691.1 ferritin-like domain-containing protein [Sporichthya sp.]